jgi:hypothetical protein
MSWYPWYHFVHEFYHAIEAAPRIVLEQETFLHIKRQLTLNRSVTAHGSSYSLDMPSFVGRATSSLITT